MPPIVRPLSPTEVKNAKPSDKVKTLADGRGLELRINPSGSKSWYLRYSRPITKQRNMISLGTYPEVSLAEARVKRDEAKALLANGIDPVEHRIRQAELELALVLNTFELVANRWMEMKASSVSPRYFDDLQAMFKRHIFPDLGNTPIGEIRAPKLIKTLKPLAASGKLETVRRLAQRVNEVMTYAVNCGLIESNPCAGVSKAFEKPAKGNMAALSPEELPELIQALSDANITLQTRCLIEWSLHTLARPNEAAGARWDEIDFEAKVWRISAERMKMNRPHRVPLTKQALALLEIMRPISGRGLFIFPSHKDPKNHTNTQTANAALKRMGFAGRLVAHGLRSLGSTTLNAQGFDRDVIEAALAHIGSDEVRNAYNRTDYLERRTPMMAWWSDHIEQASKGDLSLASGFKGLKVVGMS